MAAALLVTVLACGTGDSAVDPPGPPASLKVVAGDAQDGTVGAELANPVVVQVLDAAGRGVPGQTVSFVVATGGGNVAAGAAMTNADGRAQERWTLGTSTAPTQTLEVRAVDAKTGQKLLSTTVSATAKPGPLAVLAAVAGDGQQAQAGTALPQPLVVLAHDAFGNSIGGGTVTWTVASGGGSLGAATSPIGADGRAQVSWTLGAAVGAQTVTAQSGGKSVTFSATATTPPPGPPASIVVVSGNAQEGVVGSELPAALVVRVLDAAGRAVPGQSVSFVVTSGGGSVFAGTSVTNADGQAVDRWTLGTSTAQAQSVEARAIDPQTGQKLASATFTATPKPGPAASLTLVSGNAQTGAFNTALANPLVVMARDSYGNAATGATVTWTEIVGGGSFNPSSSIVGADGKAQTVWTLGNAQADQSAVARTAGVSPGVSFSAHVPAPSRWEPMSSPTTQTLRSVWGASANDVWAVGDAGTILHYDGTSWTAQASGTTATIDRVWGVSSTEVYASTPSSILKYDGTSWTSFPRPPALTGKLVSTWIASPTLAIASLNQDDAVFGADSILRWDGTSWKTELRNAGDIKGVFIDNQGRAVAGGGIATGAGASNDGTGWKKPWGFRTFSVSGTSWDDVWTTSGTNSSTAILRHFSALAQNFSLSGDNLAYVPGWFVSSSEVYVFGASPTVGAERPLVRFSGSTNLPATGTAESINGYAMWGAGSAQLFVVGAGGAIYHNTR